MARVRASRADIALTIIRESRRAATVLACGSGRVRAGSCSVGRGESVSEAASAAVRALIGRRFASKREVNELIDAAESVWAKRLLR